MLATCKQLRLGFRRNLSFLIVLAKIAQNTCKIHMKWRQNTKGFAWDLVDLECGALIIIISRNVLETICRNGMAMAKRFVSIVFNNNGQRRALLLTSWIIRVSLNQ